jgi:hypothetical protein
MDDFADIDNTHSVDHDGTHLEHSCIERGDSNLEAALNGIHSKIEATVDNIGCVDCHCPSETLLCS